MSRLGQLAKVESHQQILELVSDYSLPDNQYFFDRLVIETLLIEITYLMQTSTIF